MPKKFKEIYRAYPAIIMGIEDIECSNNIILPPSALSLLSSFLENKERLLFKILNIELNKETHCGVLEFTSQEGCCYIPSNMFDILSLEEGQKISLEIKDLNFCSYIKVKPCKIFSMNYPKIDMDMILRYNLLNYYCITEGDIISVKFGMKIYKFEIVECKPDRANKLITGSFVINISLPAYYESKINLFNKRVSKSLINKGEILKLYTDEKFKGHHFRIDGKEVTLRQAMKIYTKRKKEKNDIDNYDPRKNRIQSNPRPEFKYIEI